DARAIAGERPSAFLEAQRGAEAVGNGRAILLRQGPGVVGDGDLGDDAKGARLAEQEAREARRRSLLGDRHGGAEAERLGGGGDVRGGRGGGAAGGGLAPTLLV